MTDVAFGDCALSTPSRRLERLQYGDSERFSYRTLNFLRG